MTITKDTIITESILQEITSFNAVILIIDPQQGWMNPHSLPRMTSLAEFINKNDYWKNCVITAFQNTDESNFRTLMPQWKGFRQSPDIDLLESFRSQLAPVFTRCEYGLSSQTIEYLSLRGTTSVVLCGVETDASIVKVAMDLFDIGISVWVPEVFCASSYGNPGHDRGISILEKVLGVDRVLSYEETVELCSKLFN